MSRRQTVRTIYTDALFRDRMNVLDSLVRLDFSCHVQRRNESAVSIHVPQGSTNLAVTAVLECCILLRSPTGESVETDCDQVRNFPCILHNINVVIVDH